MPFCSTLQAGSLEMLDLHIIQIIINEKIQQKIMNKGAHENKFLPSSDFAGDTKFKKKV